MSNEFTNNLINEKSPYLLQHAHNPVNWYPWGDEAFIKAKRENKPIFLSIGYSTCHWCHVMEHESFEDPETAKLMNDAFVNIKVDREERPDIDNIYMTVCQIVNGNGGWPLSIVMTPNKKPFFAGTYIPKESRNGRLGMKDMCTRTIDIWKKNHEDILKSANELTSHLNTEIFSPNGQELDDKIFRKLYHDLAASYDSEFGGFGTKPKFPLAHNLIYLIDYAKNNPNSEAKEMIENTLIKMRFGGIYDHVGGGFHRYSTDEKWAVPHFEKMIYDQAMMILAYSKAFSLSENPLFKNTVYEIVEYLEREMQNEDGAFYSAQDADTEGEEGKYYLWSISEIRNALPGKTENFVKIFNVSSEGNYLDELTQDFTGKNILHMNQSVEKYATYNNLNVNDLKNEIIDSLRTLRKIRDKKTKPGLDNKILTDWNGLIIAAFSVAARIFNDNRLINKAYGVIDFVKTKMFDEKLYHRYNSGEKGIIGMIDDYASFIWGLLEYYKSSGDEKVLEFAVELQNMQIKEFYDEQNGGFYFTSESGEKLIARKKELYDGALPSGNSVTYMNLNRLYKLTGNKRYSEIADKTQKLFAGQIMQTPGGYSQFISGYGYNSKLSKEIIISSENSESAEEYINLINLKDLPYYEMIFLNNNSKDKLKKIAPFTSEYEIESGKTMVYICENFSCMKPIKNINDLKSSLK